MEQRCTTCFHHAVPGYFYCLHVLWDWLADDLLFSEQILGQFIVDISVWSHRTTADMKSIHIQTIWPKITHWCCKRSYQQNMELTWNWCCGWCDSKLWLSVCEALPRILLGPWFSAVGDHSSGSAGTFALVQGQSSPSPQTVRISSPSWS